MMHDLVLAHILQRVASRHVVADRLPLGVGPAGHAVAMVTVAGLRGRVGQLGGGEGGDALRAGGGGQGPAVRRRLRRARSVNCELSVFHKEYGK